MPMVSRSSTFRCPKAVHGFETFKTPTSLTHLTLTMVESYKIVDTSAHWYRSLTPNEFFPHPNDGRFGYAVSDLIAALGNMPSLVSLDIQNMFKSMVSPLQQQDEPAMTALPPVLAEDRIHFPRLQTLTFKDNCALSCARFLDYCILPGSTKLHIHSSTLFVLDWIDTLVMRPIVKTITASAP